MEYEINVRIFTDHINISVYEWIEGDYTSGMLEEDIRFAEVASCNHVSNIS